MCDVFTTHLLYFPFRLTPDSPLHLSLQPHVLFFVFIQATESNLCCPGTHGHRATHWSMAIPPERRHTLPFQHPLSIAPHLGWGSCSPPPSMLECWLTWSQANNRSYRFTSTIMVTSRAHCFAPVLTHPWRLWSFHFLSLSKQGCDVDVSLVAEYWCSFYPQFWNGSWRAGVM